MATNCWLANASLDAITGDLPIAKAKSNKELHLRGARFTMATTCATSGAAIGACHIQYGPTSGNLSTIVVGHGSSLSSPAIVETHMDISAKRIFGTFGADSSAAAPLTVTLWGDYEK